MLLTGTMTLAKSVEPLGRKKRAECVALKDWAVEIVAVAAPSAASVYPPGDSKLIMVPRSAEQRPASAFVETFAEQDMLGAWVSSRTVPTLESARGVMLCAWLLVTRVGGVGGA